MNSASYSGAPRNGEPGTHTLQLLKEAQLPQYSGLWVWVPGSGLRAAPGMTTQ